MKNFIRIILESMSIIFILWVVFPFIFKMVLKGNPSFTGIKLILSFLVLFILAFFISILSEN